MNILSDYIVMTICNDFIVRLYVITICKKNMSRKYVKKICSDKCKKYLRKLTLLW